MKANLLRVAWASVMVVSVAIAGPGEPIVLNNARFTVITPNCVRIETGRPFVDDPSIVAVNRQVTTEDYTYKYDVNIAVIETKAMRLRYDPAESDLSKALRVEILGTKEPTLWTPTAKNAGNLGGTARTLDGWDGPRDLGEGLLSREGWFLLDDSRSPLLTKDWVRARPNDAGTDWYLFAYGNDYRAAMKSFTTLAGDVPMPRRYTLGAWYSRYWPYTSDDFRAIVKEYTDHDFPLDVLVLDMDWHKDGWTGYSWNRKLLPDVEQFLKWVHEQGIAVTLNDHPADGLKPHEDKYPDFMRAMGHDPEQKETLPYDVGSQKYLTTFYDVVMKPLIKDGVDFWWLDWQQYPNTRSIPELTNLFWLNHYYYQRTGEDGLRGQCLTRWGGWGSHRYPIQFSGDASTNWRMLAAEVPFTSAAGNVGCFFWSHDIGGHQGNRNEESYARWCQFGATTAALRSHSTRSADQDRRPWKYPDWVEASIRRSFHLRSELFPYIYSAVWQSTRDSVPLNRPMYFDYPKEERAYHSPQEYLLGDHLLVAPIAQPGVGPRRVATQVVWFPPGDDWYNLLTGEKYEGGTESLVAADIDEFPIFARGGVPIVMQPYTPRMATTPMQTLVVRAYPTTSRKSQSATLYEDDGVTTAYRKGESATTELLYTANDEKTATIVVGPAVGTFKDQVQDRAIVIELPATQKATAVTVNGSAVSADAIAYDEATFTNRITLPAKSIREVTKVTVTASPADVDLVRRTNRARRAGVDVATLKGTDKEQLAAALKTATTDDAKQAALAAFGVGVFEKNETAYGYPEHGTFNIYAPAALVGTEKLGDQPKLGEGIFALPKPAAMAPSEPVAKVSGLVTLSLEGHPIELKAPSTPVDYKAIAENVAPLATATASTATNDSPAQGAIDGLVGGYPEHRPEEWTTVKEHGGATLTLTWNEPQTIDRVWLFDRQNAADWVKAGELVFDDGEPVPFGELPNDARTGATVAFTARTTKTLTIRIKDVDEKTQNTGLAEVVVFRAKP